MNIFVFFTILHHKKHPGPTGAPLNHMEESSAQDEPLVRVSIENPSKSIKIHQNPRIFGFVAMVSHSVHPKPSQTSCCPPANEFLGCLGNLFPKYWAVKITFRGGKFHFFASKLSKISAGYSMSHLVRISIENPSKSTKILDFLV